MHANWQGIVSKRLQVTSKPSILERHSLDFHPRLEGNGFYIETNNAEIEEQLKPQFPTVDDVKGTSPPYVGLFLRI